MSGVWSESPYGRSNRSPIATIARRFTCSGAARVRRRALEDEELARTAVPQHRERALDVLEPGHPGREEHRLARRRNGLEQRRIRDLAGGDLVAAGCRSPRAARPPRPRRDSRRRAARGSRRAPSAGRALRAESSIRFVNSQRGSGKWGGVGVEGCISASAMWVWNLTASAPASAAASISRSAWWTLPSWLLPISAMTRAGRAAAHGVPQSPRARV